MLNCTNPMRETSLRKGGKNQFESMVPDVAPAWHETTQSWHARANRLFCLPFVLRLQDGSRTGALKPRFRVFVAMQISVSEGGAQRENGAVVVRVAWRLETPQALKSIFWSNLLRSLAISNRRQALLIAAESKRVEVGVLQLEQQTHWFAGK